LLPEIPIALVLQIACQAFFDQKFTISSINLLLVVSASLYPKKISKPGLQLRQAIGLTVPLTSRSATNDILVLDVAPEVE
jgi:hypothetical protein